MSKNTRISSAECMKWESASEKNLKGNLKQGKEGNQQTQLREIVRHEWEVQDDKGFGKTRVGSPAQTLEGDGELEVQQGPKQRSETNG